MKEVKFSLFIGRRSDASMGFLNLRFVFSCEIRMKGKVRCRC